MRWCQRIGAGCLLAATTFAAADETLIAVASNFTGAMGEIVTAFEQKTGHAVKVSYGSSGKFYAQIVSGAPYDAFFSADQAKPAALEKEGRVVAGSRFTYAVGQLVLWSSRSGVVDSLGEVLKQGRFSKLALANPMLAPYGVAAVDVLRNLGLEDSTRARWVQGENIAQTYLFVQTGNADLGFVALSQVLKDGEISRGSAWRVPGTLHEPIRQDAVLLKHGEGSPAARALLDFVRTPAVLELIARHGYTTTVNEVAVAPAAFDHAVWDRLVRGHVVERNAGHETAVDYDGMTADREGLKEYLYALSAVSKEAFDGWSAKDQLAFLINAYNAWTVELILTAWPDVASIKDLGNLLRSPWSKAFIPLLGETRSLDDVEHGLIRESGRYNDPRIHFAVNCASISCPPLRSEAYTGALLDEQLEIQTRSFLGDRERNRIEGTTLKVSPIFKWYEEDFEKGWLGFRSVSGFLAHYGDALGLTSEQRGALGSGKIEISYLPYDWDLNGTDAGADPF